jgi:WD40 repeat protein
VPLYRISLVRVETREELTLSSLSFNISSLSPSTKIVCTTEEGEIVYADWGPSAEGNRVQRVLKCHHGPVCALQRSPFFEDVVMTVGDWTVVLWRDGMSLPILVSPHCGAAVTSSKWSPTRPGVFYVGRADGYIDVWDLVDKIHGPSLSQQVAPCALISMQFPQFQDTARHYNQLQLAVGDERGTLHLLEVPKNLARPVTNERALIEQVIRQEQARVDYATQHR